VQPSFLEPVLPSAVVGVRHFDIEEQAATGLEVSMKTAQRLKVLQTRAPQPEGTAHDYRSIPAGRGQFVHSLHEQCRREMLALGTLSAMMNHVGRDITPIHVEAGADPR
jgi:hypothetical protein